MNYEYLDLDKYLFMLHGKSTFDNVMAGNTSADVIAQGGDIQMITPTHWVIEEGQNKPVQRSVLYVVADYAELEAAVDRAVSAAYKNGVERGLSGD